MQIILKENENGYICLFDTRSEQFFEKGCVKSVESGQSLLNLANEIAKKPTKKIIEIADSFVYGETGYTDAMLAEKYLKLNPDLRESNKEKLQLKKDKKNALNENGKRGRPKRK